MAAAIQERLSARIINELEIGPVFYHLSEAALWINVSVHVNDFNGCH
jgi:hypothetical protein